MRHDVEIMRPKTRRVWLECLQRLTLADLAQQQRGRYNSARAMGMIGSKRRPPDSAEEQCAAEIDGMMEPFHPCKAVKNEIRFIRELERYVAKHPE